MTLTFSILRLRRNFLAWSMIPNLSNTIWYSINLISIYEAVTVVICNEHGHMRIRDIEWGRP